MQTPKFHLWFLLNSASTYNQERRSDYYEDYVSSDDDFIDDGDDYVKDDDVVRRKKRKKSKKKVKDIKKVESDEDESNEEEDEEEDALKTGNSNDNTAVIKDTIHSRRASLKEKNGKNLHLEKLQRLRATRGLSLKERQGVVENGSEEESDSARHHPYEERESDRDFIVSSDEDEDDEFSAALSDNDNKNDGVYNGDGGKVASHARVIMESSSEDDEKNAFEISLDENELLFFKSVRDNDIETARSILTTHVNFVDILNEDKDTALHTATKLKHSELVKVLLECGAKPNTGNAEHQAPALCYAAMNKDPKCFEILLKETDLLRCNDKIFRHLSGKNLLHIIVEDARTDIVEAARIAQCIEMLRKHDKLFFVRCLSKLDNDHSTPLVAAIKTGCFQVRK